MGSNELIGIRNTDKRKFDLVKGVMNNIKANKILHGENPTHLDTIYEMAKYYAENNGMLFKNEENELENIPYYKSREEFAKLRKRIEKYIKLGYPIVGEAYKEIEDISRKEGELISFAKTQKERNEQIYNYLDTLEKRIIK